MLYAAPCIAVSPFLSTVLGSAPKSSNIFTASTASLSSPASSCGSAVPTPAAAISGVVPLKFGRRGSAPNFSSSRISGTSSRSAAKRNGVAPSVPMLDDVLGCLGCAFGQSEIDVGAALHDLTHEVQTREAARSGCRRGIADVARVRLSHPGNHMEWSESGAHIVGIGARRSEEHTSELQSRVDISYAVFCLTK